MKKKYKIYGIEDLKKNYTSTSLETNLGGETNFFVNSPSKLETLEILDHLLEKLEQLEKKIEKIQEPNHLNETTFNLETKRKLGVL